MPRLIEDRIRDAVRECLEELELAIENDQWDNLTRYYCGVNAWEKLVEFRSRLNRRKKNIGKLIGACYNFEWLEPNAQPVLEPNGRWLIETIEYWKYVGEKAPHEDSYLVFSYRMIETHHGEPEFCIDEYRYTDKGSRPIEPCEVTLPHPGATPSP